MRRILIDDRIKDLADDYVKDVLDKVGDVETSLDVLSEELKKRSTKIYVCSADRTSRYKGGKTCKVYRSMLVRLQTNTAS